MTIFISLVFEWAIQRDLWHFNGLKLETVALWYVYIC